MLATLLALGVTLTPVASLSSTSRTGERLLAVSFTDIGAGLPPLERCAAAWGDYNADGYLDLLLCGLSNGTPITRIYRNQAATAFVDIQAGLPGVYDGAVAWGDHDGDGDLDLALCGNASTGSPEPIARIYRNDGGTFADVRALLPGAGADGRGAVAWGDYDNDGDLDLALGGAGPLGTVSTVYLNHGNSSFSTLAALPSVTDGSLSWADYDADGDLDLAQTGRIGTTAVSNLLRNDAGTFVTIGAGLVGLSESASAWDDYDYDGDLDLAITGRAADGQYRTVLYRKGSGSTLVDAAAGLPGSSAGSVAWGDYDNDGDLDLLVGGAIYSNTANAFAALSPGLPDVTRGVGLWGDYDGDGDLDVLTAGSGTAQVFRNDGAPLNTTPTRPQGVSHRVSGNVVTLSWFLASDTPTPRAGLTFNVRVGTTRGGGEIMPAMADAGTGRRNVAQLGNANKRSGWSLTLPPGTYYWAVQTIDGAYVGSRFTAEGTVTVQGPPPPVTIDVNSLRMAVSPQGTFAFDPATGSSGLEYPKGSGKHLAFASGLWIGTAGPRMAVSEFTDEFQPGAIVGGVPDDPGNPEYRVYKLSRFYGSETARDQALAAYNVGAVPRGAPAVNLLPSGELELLGDQMLWHVYNDGNAARHRAPPGFTAPVGVEVRQTVFAYNRLGFLGNTVYMKFEIVNRSGAALEDVYAALWCDPDLGDSHDDLVGCDVPRGMGYSYNGTNDDRDYGARPPALGYDLLQGPGTPAPAQPMSAFIKFTNDTDPTSASQTYNFMHGLLADGGPIVDPTTSAVTTYVHPGDPVAGTGWLDFDEEDRRFFVVSGPFRLDPDASTDLWAAVVVGHGTDRLSSITALRMHDDDAQRFFDSGFDLTTATLASLVSAEAHEGVARLVWHAPGATAARVERRTRDSDWAFLADVVPDGSGRFVYEDATIETGRSYGYRLALPQSHTREVWLDVPAHAALALDRLSPNPVAGDLLVSFTLPAEAPVRLELFDASGRRLRVREELLRAGRHVVRLAAQGELPPGIVLVRLTQAGRSVTTKGVVLR